MKYMLFAVMALVMCGCGKKDGKIDREFIQYDTSFFGNTLTVYDGELTKEYEYDELKTTSKKTWMSKNTISGRFSCMYSGMCLKMGEFGFNITCNGHRQETREYTHHLVEPTISVIRYGQVSLYIDKPSYTSKTYKTLKSGSCN